MIKTKNFKGSPQSGPAPCSSAPRSSQSDSQSKALHNPVQLLVAPLLALLSRTHNQRKHTQNEPDEQIREEQKDDDAVRVEKDGQFEATGTHGVVHHRVVAFARPAHHKRHQRIAERVEVPIRIAFVQSRHRSVKQRRPDNCVNEHDHQHQRNDGGEQRENLDE
eukprot:371730_1